MSNTVLLTLGRLPKALDVARGFSAAGWRVVIAEPFGLHLSRFSNAVTKTYRVTAPNTNPDHYRRDLLQVIEQEAPRLIVPISEETLHVAALADVLPPDTPLFTVDQKRLITLHDKLTFARLAQDFGLAAPNSAELDGADAGRIAASGPYVIKPRNNASGTGVTFHSAGDPLPNPEEFSDRLIQEQIVGETVSSFSIAHDGRSVATVLYRGVVFDGMVAVCFERDDGLPDARNWIDTFIEKSRHTGFIAFDFIITSDGKAVAVECNPRATSGIHFLAENAIAPLIQNALPKGAEVLREKSLLQQFYPTLVVTQGSVTRWADFKRNAKALARARDVTWQMKDPLPFILMTPASYHILRQTIMDRISMGEAAIRDIGWFGPQKRSRPRL